MIWIGLTLVFAFAFGVYALCKAASDADDAMNYDDEG